MACSEEVDWGQPKEEQQSDAEQTDAIIHRTSAKRKKNEERDLDAYTYETYSDSFDETDMDRSVTSRDKLQRRKSCHRRGNEKPDSSQVIAASSKYKARPVKPDSSQVLAASSKYKARPVKAIESQQSTSSCTGGCSDAMRPRRVLLRPNVQSQIADTEAYRKTTDPLLMSLFMVQFWQYVVLRSYFDHIDNTDSTGSPDPVSPRAWSTHSLLLDHDVWDYIRIPCQVFEELLGEGTECNAIVDKLYEGPELKLHQDMWNIMTTDKEGKYKNNNDNASGHDTGCEGILCSENEHVVSNVCTPCTVGKYRAAGDDASDEPTQCNDIICEKDYRVVNKVCTPCELGKYNNNNDKASGHDTP